MKIITAFIFMVFLACNNKTSQSTDGSASNSNSTPNIESDASQNEGIVLDSVKTDIDENSLSGAFILNENFAVGKGNIRSLKDTDFSLEIVDIRDNRCPPNVQCIRAGEIEVDVMLKKGDNNKKETLTYPTAEKPGSVKSIAFDNFQIDFLGALRAVKSGKIDAPKPKFKVGINDLKLSFIVKELASK